MLEVYASFAAHLLINAKQQVNIKALHSQLQMACIKICSPHCQRVCPKYKAVKAACNFAAICKQYPGFVLLSIGKEGVRKFLMDKDPIQNLEEPKKTMGTIVDAIEYRTFFQL